MIRDYIDIEQRGDVAILWLDEQGRSVNTISPNALDAFEEAFDKLDRDDSVRAAVIASRKERSFVAGADLDMLAAADTPDEAATMSRRGHLLIRRARALSIPLVAAIDGPALGGGLELALACTYRVASEEAPTRFALPEVMLGLLPGGGGTQLLPRLVGLQQALPLMLTGKNVYPHRAKKIGLVDLLTHRHNLVNAAVAAARDLADGRLKPDRSRSLTDRALEGTAIGRRVIYGKAAVEIEKETGGNFPAPPLILKCVRRGMEDGMERGFEAESEHFGRLVFTPEHRALVGIFRAKQHADKNPFEGGRHVDRIAVIGAGLMGSGIAEVSAANGLEVRLMDANLEAAARGRKSVWRGLSKKVNRRQITSFEAETVLERVVPVDAHSRIASAQVVIEAVPEDLELKRAVLADVEGVTDDDAIFASNTSSIPIADIAAGARRPERVVGMHYFSPVPQRPLLEVVRKGDTPEDVLATVCELGLRQGKSVIVVRDGPGFYTTRILGIYLNEAMALLEEGFDAEAIDRAMKAWGFPMGPFELIDLVGVDVAAKVTPVLTEHMQDRDLPTSDLPAGMLNLDLLGQKNGKGFYTYEKKDGKTKPKHFNREIYDMLGSTERRQPVEREVQERLGLLMVNEAAHCLDEGILDSPADGDLGAVFGLGFPPFRGGPFRLIAHVGPANVAARLERLADRHGERFKPAAFIR